MTRKNHGSRGKNVAIGVALYCAAVVAGVGSAWWVLKQAPWMRHIVQVGAWQTDLTVGGPSANMYLRAWVALNGLLVLERSETMYFVANKDDTGRPLRSRCTYRVEGVEPKARWWSITAYADDMFLFDAPQGHYSLNGSTARLDRNGRFALTTGGTEQALTHWLPTPGDRGVVLTLRLYNPEPSLQAAPGSLVAPSIVRLGECL